MRKFDWKLAAEDFVRVLDAWTARARKIATTRGAQRHVASVRRRRQHWYKTVNRLSELPPRVLGLSDAEAWVTTPAQDLNIVIPPTSREDAEAPYLHAELRLQNRRKSLRRAIHDSEEVGDRAVVLVSARRTRRRLPSLAVSSGSAHAEARALYLDNLGLAIVPNLSSAQIAALRESGATVLPNELIIVDDPEVSPDEADLSSGTDATGRGKAETANAGHLDDISIRAARAKGLTGVGVTIGILDSGIAPAHPEFAGKTIQFMAFKTNGERKEIKPKDYGDHGTHVAALAAGRTVGVAPDADLCIAAVLTQELPQGGRGGTVAQILAGLNWLAGTASPTGPVDVINASLGSASPDSFYATVLTHHLQNKLIVAAIGNDGSLGSHLSPAMLDCVVGVGAVNRSGRVANFSAWGPCYASPVASTAHKPDLMAPGVAVMSAVPKRGYAPKNGTSMASPLVAGAAALLLQRDPSLRKNAEHLTSALLALTKPLPQQPTGYDPNRGGRGVLDLSSI